jgi:hypothetical protein
VIVQIFSDYEEIRLPGRITKVDDRRRRVTVENGDVFHQASFDDVLRIENPSK